MHFQFCLCCLCGCYCLFFFSIVLIDGCCYFSFLISFLYYINYFYSNYNSFSFNTFPYHNSNNFKLLLIFPIPICVCIIYFFFFLSSKNQVHLTFWIIHVSHSSSQSHLFFLLHSDLNSIPSNSITTSNPSFIITFIIRLHYTTYY